MLQTSHRQQRQKDSLFCHVSLVASSLGLLKSQGNTPSRDSESVKVIANRYKTSLISHILHSSVPVEKPDGKLLQGKWIQGIS